MTNENHRMTQSILRPNHNGQLLLYQTEDGQTKVEVRLENDSLWLTQAQMADLFQTTPQNITLHLKNIYDSEELSEAATCKEYLQVQNEGKRQVSRNRLLDPEHKLHPAYKKLDRLGVTQIICDFCSRAFHVQEDLKNGTVPLVAEFEGHPSIVKWIKRGYTPIVL